MVVGVAGNLEVPEGEAMQRGDCSGAVVKVDLDVECGEVEGDLVVAVINVQSEMIQRLAD